MNEKPGFAHGHKVARSSNPDWSGTFGEAAEKISEVITEEEEEEEEKNL